MGGVTDILTQGGHYTSLSAQLVSLDVVTLTPPPSNLLTHVLSKALQLAVHIAARVSLRAVENTVTFRSHLFKGDHRRGQAVYLLVFCSAFYVEISQFCNICMGIDFYSCWDSVKKSHVVLTDVNVLFTRQLQILISAFSPDTLR